jgi:hypothetical protein
MLLMRTGAATSDYIAPQAGSAGERFMWVEYAQFRSNTPLSQQQQQQQQRSKPLPKQTPAVQEYFEQLMACKCKCGWQRLCLRGLTSTYL